ncbi:MAG: glycoside hydrolase family 13 protein [Candidatus Sericytochromatia bacterium]
MKHPIVASVSSLLLAAAVLAACAGPQPVPFNRANTGPVRSLNANTPQSDLSRFSIGQAKNQIAARQQTPPAVGPVRSARSTARVTTPEWVKDAVFYQIFPERFHNGDPKNDPPGTEPWGSQPKLFNYMGGDLEGVIQKMPYLKELGINAIYFNPVFEAPTSNHKYDTTDYLKLDPSFGDMSTFRRLVDTAHANGIKVVLDAVFNHSGDKHWAFQDAMKNGPQSKYWNWYLIHGFPVVQNPKPNYDSWWGFASLPKFNEYNPEVRNYLYQVAEFWTKQGIDGWRLDVPNEVRDMEIWREFRRRVKRLNPDAYIVGEIWGDGSPWLQGDQFDAVMNYQFREQVFNFLMDDKANVDQFDWGLEGLRNRHPDSVTYSMFNVLGSHDTARVVTMAKKDMNKVKLAALFQMTYVGAPVIYYGDEIGLEGEMDPDCRRAMPWNPSQWNQDLRNYYKRLIQIRKQYPALRRGGFRSLMRHNDNRTFAYLREDAQSKLMVVMNNHTRAQDIPIDTARVSVPDGTLRDLISGRSYPIRNGSVVFGQVPPKSGMLLEWSAAR